MSYCSSYPEQLKSIFRLLVENTSVTNFQLNNTLINEELQQSLGHSICHNNTLQHVFLHNVNLGDNGARILSQDGGVSSISSLIILSLESANIGMFGGIALGEMLQRNTTLYSLHLRRNNIGQRVDNIKNDAIRALGKGIRVNVT